MSKPELDNSKRQAALASRRARDKKARDCLEDRYIRKLLRREFNDEVSREYPDLVEFKRIALYVRRFISGRASPELIAAYQTYAERRIQEIERGSPP